MRVLLATDGSKDARGATAFLQMLPLPSSSEIRIAAVVPRPAFVIDVPAVREYERSALEDARRVVEDARASLAPRGFGTETDVTVGDPRAEIVRIADEWRADMVVLGARGLGKVQRLLLGSVSLGVARHAPCPVLVVKGRPRKVRRVLVAMDGSDDSFRAARFVLTLPLPRQTKLHLLSVVEPTRYPTSTPAMLRSQVAGMLAELESERRAGLEKVLETAAGYFDDHITRVTRSMRRGDPAAEIVATAIAYNTDLLVVGARGLGAMARLLLGSVSEKALHASRSAVLIVKDRPERP